MRVRSGDRARAVVRYRVARCSLSSHPVRSLHILPVIDSEVKDVPSLKAPGFIKAAADGKYADASALIGGDVVLTVRSSTPTYAGFRITVASGTASPDYSCAGCV